MSDLRRFDEKLEWLLKNPETWWDYKFTEQSESKYVLFKIMQTAGLYSERTNWFDTAIVRLVARARLIRKLRLKYEV